MIFLPKSFERYIAALRFYIHLSIAHHGLQQKHFVLLKKINLAESFYYAGDTVPVNIIKLSNSLLGACVIIMLQRGRNLAVSFKGCGTYLINKRLYISLIMGIIEKCSGRNCEIVVTAENDKIAIKVYGCRDISNFQRIIKVLCGTYYRESTSRTIIISIPATRTCKNSVEIENEWCYLVDKFSPVNIFLKNYPIDNNL